MKKKNILVIVAHRDDETFGCCGTISKYIKQNWKVFAISMTDGVSARVSTNKSEIERRFKKS